MTDNVPDHEPSRRDYMKHGSAVVVGGLLAGCAGQSDTEPTAEADSTENGTDSTDGEGGTAETDSSYTVSMIPMGEVSFDSPPETWISFLSTYGDMGIALGQADGLQGLWNPDDVPVEIYNTLPGVDISFDDVTPIEGLDKETLYELDSDLHLIDPNWLETLADGIDQADTEEISQAVGPFLGNFIRRRGDDWHDYEYYSLYDAFEIVAEAFDERERYDELAAVNDELQSRVQSSLPASEDRPSVGILSVNSEIENGSFWAYPLQDGNNHKQYRDLEIEDGFADHIDGNFAEWDYEQLLEADPDILLFQYGLTHVSAETFEERMNTIREDSLGSQLTAVENDRLYRGGSSYQGPILNMFQTEVAAKQFYPEAFGEWNGQETLANTDDPLFDRQRVADIINGEF